MYRLAALLLTAAAASLLAGAVTPVEKVVTLLENLKAEVEGDGASEAKAYDEFACFCKETTKSKSTSITTGQDTIDTESAKLTQDTAEKESQISHLAKLKTEGEQLAATLKEKNAIFKKETEEFDATKTDLDKAIMGLEGAIKSMEGSKPSSFLALRQTLKRAAAEVTSEGGSRQRLVGELLARASVDPTDPEYKFHSQNIIDTVTELLEEFTDERNELVTEYEKTSKAHTDLVASLDAEIETNKEATSDTEALIEELTLEIAEARKKLHSAEAVLKDDQLYLKDLTEMCEVRATDYDQRSKMRHDEIAALAEALSILDKGVKTQDAAANKRALLLQPKPRRVAKAPSFLQLRGDRAAGAVGGSAMIKKAAHEEALSAADARARRAVALLQNEGRRLGAAELTVASARATGSPFDKVKGLIQELIERLLAESTAEASKQGFCNTDMGKAKKDRDARFAGTQKLSAEIEQLEAKEDALVQELSELSSSLKTLNEDLDEANHTRVTEKAENMETLKTAKEGVEAVTMALAVLKSFYKQAAKAVALVDASPVAEDTSGPGFAGAYKGKQEASAGVLGLLEVIKSDFERTLTKTAAAEKEAAAQYVEFHRASKADISGKETKTSLNTEDLETTRTGLKLNLEDLTKETKLLDTALQRLEELKPTCTDLTMPYAERVKKRDEEMAALRTALCILDTEKVESECT